LAVETFVHPLKYCAPLSSCAGVLPRLTRIITTCGEQGEQAWIKLDTFGGVKKELGFGGGTWFPALGIVT